jgi:hypothetical protein
MLSTPRMATPTHGEAEAMYQQPLPKRDDYHTLYEWESLSIPRGGNTGFSRPVVVACVDEKAKLTESHH